MFNLDLVKHSLFSSKNDIKSEEEGTFNTADDRNVQREAVNLWVVSWSLSGAGLIVRFLVNSPVVCHPFLQNLPVQHVQDPILLVQGLILAGQISPDLTVAGAKLVYIWLTSTWSRQLHLVKVFKLKATFPISPCLQCQSLPH